MSWRSIQLGDRLCEQDLLILNLFGNRPVKYVGQDLEFSQHLNIDQESTDLVLIFDYALWCSDIINVCKKFVKSPIKNFYIGINRYCVLGNDTNLSLTDTAQQGQSLINFLSTIVDCNGYTVEKSGCYDNDWGKRFNFVQPLTWIYGTAKRDHNN